MKYLIIALLISTVGYSQVDDKVLHFAGGGAFGTAAWTHVYSKTQNKVKATVWSTIAAIGIGVIKEAIDENNYKGWDNKDLMFTALGGLTAGLTLDLIISKKTTKYKRKKSLMF